jgi:hypothetical protein
MVLRRCPWCKEKVEERESLTCIHCDGELRGTDGRELRDIDLRYQEVEADQQRRLKDVLIYGSVVVGAITLVLPLLHIGAALVTPLVVIAHMLLLKIYLIRRSRQLLGRTRRFFLRWISRFSFLWIGIPGYGLGAIPLVGMVIGVITFAGLTLALNSYSLWSLHQEYRRVPLAAWEKMVLLILTVVSVLAFLMLICATLLLGFSVTWFVEWVQSLS